ncbi:MAG: DUF2189 domain-containing protein [Alphaproteobacteria bacterium]|nr:DUF2189 domain-containing protein [Alphaproteobacteria bacterium]
MTIRNPVEWSVDQFRHAASAVESAGRVGRRTRENLHSPAPAVRRIGVADLGLALTRGYEDFAAYRTDVIFLCVVYPLVGLVLARLAFGYDLLPLIFPLASGFALIGPLAAVGLNEMSRRREAGMAVTWADAFGVFRSPSFGAIVLLGLVLMAIFLLWLLAAEAIYEITLGPAPPASVGGFVHDVLATPEGWTMIGLGVGVGFLFALLVLAISAVSFPLLLDREVGVDTAVLTSIRAVFANPAPMAAWGLIVAGGLVIGSIPFFLGLIIVMPVLGHATWHLYRQIVPR